MKSFRYAASTCLVSVVVLAVNGIGWCEEGKSKSKRVRPAGTELFEIRNIEGWSVYIKKQDLADHRDEMRTAIDHMRNQFYQARLVVPAPAIAIMQERVPIWVEYDAGPGLSFHPSYRWLLDRGHASPEGLRSLVSNCYAKGFCKNALHQPWVVLHELTHGYDYLYIGRGRRYSNRTIKEVFQRAKASGTYDSVLCRYSTGAKHYAMSNEMEYFAENTEAYFGTNDFYPFVRAELKEHDPDGYALLEAVWGVDVRKQNRVRQSLVNFIESQKDGNGGAGSRPRRRKAYPATNTYQKRWIEGWDVYLSGVLVEQKALGDEMCKLLGHKLHLVKRYVPEKAIAELQKTAIWIERNNRAVPYMTYHGSEKKLRADKQNPDKLKGIEIGNCGRFAQWAGLQQFAILNQLARAYYAGGLKGEQVKEIEAAWEKAVEGGKYDSVLRFDGEKVRHPALGSAADFFAEMSEGYYGVNDHYPFLQFETRQYDKETCELLAKVWGGKAK